MLVLVYTVPAIYREENERMAFGASLENKTSILVKPCFNCGNIVGKDINDFREIPAGSTGNVHCFACGVNGPSSATTEDALAAWNDLHDRMQASKAYNTLAGVSSPMEFAGWVKTMKEHAEEILKTKASFENKKRIQDAWDAMRNATNKASEATGAFAGSFTYILEEGEYKKLSALYEGKIIRIPGGWAGFKKDE